MTWITLILLIVIAWLVSRFVFVVDAYRRDLADLRAQLRDCQRPANPAATTPASATDTVTPNVSTAPVKLNSASKNQLQRLPKVGAVTAQRIIDARPFNDVDDLAEVKGIHGDLFTTLKPLVTL
ncbi:hypothetical protein FKG94_10750 [Exilibacterium tricleocarpae]|uniref:Helix-hairpin-helix domain-containing protein n=1 Tax=Exilibacterium tricleocarpae TaxID=2591008 RepID=A0A545TSD6_9GAMM|nr:helix-hairpin-helix domain-containing protein [Exilibacterium tricleocarpae]TQV80138.1 hypothetical protein FKG94_10750 [Exilibacterium tricleocarpae]